MSFPVPAASGYVLFSKQGCVLCDKMKTVFETRAIRVEVVACDAWVQGEHRPAFLEHLKALSKQTQLRFPFVFHRGAYIGGFHEARKYVEDEAEEW